MGSCGGSSPNGWPPCPYVTPLLFWIWPLVSCSLAYAVPQQLGVANYQASTQMGMAPSPLEKHQPWAQGRETTLEWSSIHIIQAHRVWELLFLHTNQTSNSNLIVQSDQNLLPIHVYVRVRHIRFQLHTDPSRSLALHRVQSDWTLTCKIARLCPVSLRGGGTDLIQEILVVCFLVLYLHGKTIQA